jgi:hypothetical protein
MACKKKPMTEQQACAARRSLYRSGKAAPGSLWVYQCKKCGHNIYHIGHRRYWSKVSPKTWQKIIEQLENKG